MALTRRKAPVAKPAPENLYETTVCAPVEEVVIKRERVLCTKCHHFDEYRNGLCLNDYKESQGFEYDEEQNRFVLKTRKKK